MVQQRSSQSSFLFFISDPETLVCIESKRLFWKVMYRMEEAWLGRNLDGLTAQKADFPAGVVHLVGVALTRITA